MTYVLICTYFSGCKDMENEWIKQTQTLYALIVVKNNEGVSLGIHPRSIVVTYFVRIKGDLEEAITIIHYLALTIEFVKDGATVDVTSSCSFKRLLL